MCNHAKEANNCKYLLISFAIFVCKEEEEKRKRRSKGKNEEREEKKKPGEIENEKKGGRGKAHLGEHVIITLYNLLLETYRKQARQYDRQLQMHKYTVMLRLLYFDQIYIRDTNIFID